MMTLDSLVPGDWGKIVSLKFLVPDDAISRRLSELGFIPGAIVKVLAVGPFGRDPIALRIGATRFALRVAEARRISVEQHVASLGGG